MVEVADGLLYDPPKPAKNFLPDWYSNHPKYTTESNKPELFPFNTGGVNSTFRNCVPLTDAMSAGYIWGLPFDIQFRKMSDSTYEISWRPNMDSPFVDIQNANEAQGIPLSVKSADSTVFKWMCGYSVSTPKGYSTLFTHPLNRSDLPFRTFSGIVDTDKYHIPVNFPFQIELNLELNETYILKKNTPLIQIIPFKRESWIHSTIKEFKPIESKRKMIELFYTIKNSYKTNYWTRKSWN